MPVYRFSAEELAAFAQRVERCAAWSGWKRRSGDNGEDVIELDIDDSRSTRILIAKTRDGYVAKGLASWGLAVCDNFDELVDVIAQVTAPRAPATLGSYAALGAA